MDFSWALERVGDSGAAALGGLVVGLLFGFCAQRSRFCLRAATIEFWRGSLGPRTAVWLMVFGAALLGTQLLFSSKVLDASQVRQLSQTGTLSGAILGGILFGVGMILARGCASRLLVLSATGNLRALVAGLILTVAAQASLSGALSPLRLELASWWTVTPATRDLASMLPPYAGLLIALPTIALALWLARHHRLGMTAVLTGLGVGSAVVLGWWFNATLAAQAFDIIPVQSVSFSGPSADTLMVLISQPEVTVSFGLGLVPGVFAGSFLSAISASEFRIETFNNEVSLPRYIIGAILMGFGSMLAGGCAVGAGVTGGSVMALTAWIALLFMWLSAGVTDLLLDRPSEAGIARREPASAISS
jgi:uncharacterized membrane protein YedE/YeeE